MISQGASRAVTPPARKHNGPGKPWLERETALLIDAYEERWSSLKRGQLKAHQWEEVAGSVAAKLGLSRPSKSGTQCRHKIEKLRQRYRAELQRGGSSSRWTFFDRIDRMERGPLPISVRPPPPPSPLPRSGEGESVEEVAAAVRRFREGLARLQKRSLEMVIEMERDWTKMETRRTEMVIESQRRLVEVIAMAFSAKKKPRRSHRT
ncbi:unnamed protein product [Spirodela intermedia]|uniref:Myb-like domain-containing protein n=1 Tax=Spirodela intermedia TaxID=51605 RepID=A0A7I8J2D8_SPIIN|nr:unnamed protein product [Spirodela intermedia]CAA6664386.1 unnamed protein product [Spirodela intermedia]